MTNLENLELGAVEVRQVVEWQGEIAPVSQVIPDVPAQLWRDNESWLAPEHWNPATDNYRAAARTWVLRSAGRTILVDTGIGNDRDRPQIPLFTGLHTDFLDRLGVPPEEVDIVVNTHVHYDHVGWNTRRVDGEWVPAFPNATYLIPEPDAAYFDPANAHRRPPPRDEAEALRQRGSQLVYADSIAPVLGQAIRWADGYRIDEHLTLEPAPGHTPGSAVLRLDSAGQRAVFVGDLLHSPVQILRPEHSSCFCEDPAEAASTREKILAQAADQRELVFPAHFAGRGAVEVSRDGSRFAVRRWV